jgi:ADP-ribosylglycohydrolase
MLHQIRGAFIGLAVGDALGVPVEFRTREWAIGLARINDIENLCVRFNKAISI